MVGAGSDDDRAELVRRYKRLIDEALESMDIDEIRELVREMEEELRNKG